MNIDKYKRLSRKSIRRSSSRLSRRVTVANRLFSEEDDDEQDSHGSYININIERLRFPLPVQTNESLCRDEYLTKLLKPFKKVDVEITKRVSHEFEAQRKNNLTAEGLAVLQMIDLGRKQQPETVESDESFKITMSPEEKKRRYAICMVQFQKAAIEFLSVRLNKQLYALLKSSSGQLKTKEVPEHFFDWSVDYFIERNKSGKVNMDVILRINSEADLDRAKYTSNIGQIIDIIKHILNDYQRDINMCGSCIAEIAKANYDINSPWLRDSERDTIMYTNLLKENRRLSSICTHEREAQLQSQIDVMDGCLPIVQRYRKGWMHSTWDQIAMKMASKEKALQDELQTVSKNMQEGEIALNAAEHIYQYQINNLKSKIFEWEQRFEMDQYELELNLAKMRSNLSKENDQRTFLEEQIKMFRKKVEKFLEKERKVAEDMQRFVEPKPVIVKKSKKGSKRGTGSKQRIAKPSDKSEEKSSKSLDTSTGKGAKSVDKSKGKRSTSIDRSKEKSVKSVDKSKEKRSESVDRKKGENATSVEKSKGRRSKSVDKSQEKSAKSVEKNEGRRSKSVDKSKEKSFKSVEKSKWKRSKSAEKSREKSVKSINKIIENNAISVENRTAKKSLSGDKNKEKISKLVDKRKEKGAISVDQRREKSAMSVDKSEGERSKSVDKSNEKSMKSVDKKKGKSAMSVDKRTEKKSMSVDKIKEKSAISVKKSKGERSRSVDTSEEKSVKSVDKKKEKSAISVEKSMEKSTISVKKSKGERSKSVDTSEKKTVKSVDRRTEKGLITVVKNKEKGSESVDKKKEKSAISVDEKKGKSSLSVDKSKEERSSSRFKSKENSVSLREKSITSKSLISHRRNKGRKQQEITANMSRDKSVEKSRKLNDFGR